MLPDVVQGDGTSPVLEGLIQLKDKSRSVRLKWSPGRFFIVKMKAVGSSHPGGHSSLQVSAGQRRGDVVQGEGDAVEDPLCGGGRQEEEAVSGESEQEEPRAGFECL